MTEKPSSFTETYETHDQVGNNKTENVEQPGAGQEKAREGGAMTGTGFDAQPSPESHIVNVPAVFTRNGRYPRPSIIL